MEKLRQEDTSKDFEMNAHKMQKFISGPPKVNIMFLRLLNKLDTSSKMMCQDSMEARVFLQKDTLSSLGTPSHITKIGQYVTKKQ